MAKGAHLTISSVRFAGAGLKSFVSIASSLLRISCNSMINGSTKDDSIFISFWTILL